MAAPEEFGEKTFNQEFSEGERSEVLQAIGHSSDEEGVSDIAEGYSGNFEEKTAEEETDEGLRERHGGVSKQKMERNAAYKTGSKPSQRDYRKKWKEPPMPVEWVSKKDIYEGTYVDPGYENAGTAVINREAREARRKANEERYGRGRRDFGGRGGYGGRPRRDFGDRLRRDYGDRPRRDYGDRPKRDYGEEGEGSSEGERPRRDFGDRPRRDYGNRPRRDFGDRPKRDFDRKPRDSESSGSSSGDAEN